MHLSSGLPPIVRINGDIKRVSAPELSHTEICNLLESIVSENQWLEFNKIWELDCAVSLAEIGRFRLNIFKQQRGISATFRPIPEAHPSIETLGIVDCVKKLSTIEHGLCLITGATGSGKTTTLAAIINHINENYKKHILTIEDPIEYIINLKKPY